MITINFTNSKFTPTGIFLVGIDTIESLENGRKKFIFDWIHLDWF
jgi:hypothetical protein